MSQDHPTAESAASQTDVPAVLRVLGSLWLGAVIMVLWLVAMGAATVYESSHGAERALEVFYRSRWFEAILWLLAINTVVSVVIRFPYRWKQLGFVIAHVSVLVILAGALMTDRLAIRGQISVAEGQTVDRFSSLDHEVLAVVGPEDEPVTVRLAPEALGGSGEYVSDDGATPRLTCRGLTAEVLRHAEDSSAREWVADDAVEPRVGLEIALEEGEESRNTWVLAGESASVGPVGVSLLCVAGEDALRPLLAVPSSQPVVAGTVRVILGGVAHELSLAECIEEAAPLGASGSAIRVLHYFPHAMVTEDGEITNVSGFQVNPFIEAELIGPTGSERHVAFARFPDFMSVHGEEQSGDTRVVLDAEYITPPSTPIELIVGPGDKMHVRFATANTVWTHSPLHADNAVETPWFGLRLRLLQRLDRANRHREVSPSFGGTGGEPGAAVPAVLVRLRPEGGETREVWVRKFEVTPVTVGRRECSLVYSNEVIPLGFDLTLDRFRIDRYPGMRMERAYESQVSIVEPETGRQRSRVISMNHPVSFGKYTLFQSSYQEGMDGNMSILSVSRDPGQPVVFVGYAVLLLGMLISLFTRWRTHRQEDAA